MYIVKYTGQFGYIKPFSAVRDSDTMSQFFLTPSIIEGMRIKLGVSSILRHKLQFQNTSFQQEVTKARGFKIKKKSKRAFKPTSILNRGVLIYPILYLAFPTLDDAKNAHTQHLCLCRNEDLVYPSGEIFELSTDEFSNLKGFELLFGHDEDSIMVGYNRYNNFQKMYGKLDVK